MKNKRWTEQEDFILKNNIESPIKYLAELVGRTIPSVKNRKKALGITEENLWSEMEENIIIKYYSNSSSEKLLKLLENRSWSSILAKAKKLKLKRAEYQYSTMRDSNVEILLNESVKTYYYIGLLFADGYFTNKKIQLNQCMKNKEVVIGFANYIGCKNIKLYDEVKKVNILGVDTVSNGSAICYLKDSKVIPLINKKYDINYKKGEKTKTYFPPSLSVFNKMSDENFLSFLIGFIDGDGSLYLSKKNSRCITITSHENWKLILKYWIKRLEDIFNVTLSKKALKQKDSYFRLRIYNPIVIDYLIGFIKENKFICTHKWDKFN
jgi:hypothetical protein